MIPISSLTALIGAVTILTLTLAAEVRFNVARPADDADALRQIDNVTKLQRIDRALTMPAAVDVESVLSRPLFASNRRPETVQPLAAFRSINDELPRLAGIVINDPIRLAIFQPKSPKKAIVIGVGDAIEGEKVTAISAGDVVIAGPQGERHIQPAPDASIKRAIATARASPLPFVQPANPQAGNLPRPRGGVNFGK